jgi:hypothetical protein
MEQQLECGVGSGVAKAVEGVKLLMSEMGLYERTLLLSGCVTVESDVNSWNGHQFCSVRRAIFQDVLQTPRPAPGKPRVHGKNEVL